MQIDCTLPDVSVARSPTCVQDTSDAALIRSIADGDKRAMQVLFVRHNVMAFRFVLRLVRDESVAEDVVSEAFFELWRQADRFEGRSQVSTWLLAIARNKALSALQRRPIQQLDDGVAELLEDPADDPELTIQKRQRTSLLSGCLTRLSAAHREIIDLVYYHEKSIDEVAEIIGVPRNTVKTRMHYARIQMAKLLAAAGFDKETLWP